MGWWHKLFKGMFQKLHFYISCKVYPSLCLDIQNVLEPPAQVGKGFVEKVGNVGNGKDKQRGMVGDGKKRRICIDGMF